MFIEDVIINASVTVGALAQSVEQTTENPRVPGSIPGGATITSMITRNKSMETFVTTIHVLAALFMILVVLVQGGNQGGISAAFGGGNSQGVFGASGATSFFGKLTYGAAAIFMATSIMLIVMRSGSASDLSRKMQEKSSQSIKVEQTVQPKEQENQK